MTAPGIGERIAGAIIGTLVGDALGVPVEFTGRSVRDQDPVRDMRAFGTWNQPAGTWSDDGAMAMATVDVLATHGWELGHLMDGFRRWLDEGWWAARGAAFDVGNTTRNAIMRFRIHGDWTDCGGSEEENNGNGSLMRCMPISLWLLRGSAEQRIRLAGDASALTHAHPRSRLCCAWHALWCDASLAGRDARDAARSASQRLRREVSQQERGPLAQVLDLTAMDLPRERVPSDGYVVSTLAASLWCVANHRTFEEAVLAAVNLGGDADTTGAVTGGMAGWLRGVNAIPRLWIDELPRLAEVESLIGRFAARCAEQWSDQGP